MVTGYETHSMSSDRDDGPVSYDLVLNHGLVFHRVDQNTNPSVGGGSVEPGLKEGFTTKI